MRGRWDLLHAWSNDLQQSEKEETNPGAANASNSGATKTGSAGANETEWCRETGIEKDRDAK